MREGFFTFLGILILVSVVILVGHPGWQLLAIGLASGCLILAMYFGELDHAEKIVEIGHRRANQSKRLYKTSRIRFR